MLFLWDDDINTGSKRLPRFQIDQFGITDTVRDRWSHASVYVTLQHLI